MKNLIKNFLIFFFVFLIIAVIFSGLVNTAGQSEKVGIETLINQINNEQVDGVAINGAEMEVSLKDGKKEIVKKEANQTFSELMDNYGVEKAKMAKVKVEVTEDQGWNFWSSVTSTLTSGPSITFSIASNKSGISIIFLF